jgi:hypothetical protein
MAKAQVPARRTSRRLLNAGDGPKARIKFGVILAIGDPPVPVPITADDLTDAMSKGVKFTLQEPVVLGSIDTFIAWINKQFKLNFSIKDLKLPPPLDAVLAKMTSIIVTVEILHLDIPGTGSTSATLYTVEANGMFPPGGEIDVFGLFKIDGFVFGVSNEPVTTS